MKAGTSLRFQAACCSDRMAMIALRSGSGDAADWCKLKAFTAMPENNAPSTSSALNHFSFIEIASLAPPAQHTGAGLGWQGRTKPARPGYHADPGRTTPRSTAELLARTGEQHILCVEAEGCSPPCYLLSRLWHSSSSPFITGERSSRVSLLSPSPTRFW